ncbi:elongation factor Ts [endosymbiont of Euscepes postfasciatus]|uniref:translation elongation factor Ts n=1 Tax=endosymbiont of Euscepes postfasciatus TaxID=650377 RepID=UPI000DC6F3BF|nr:translation elongation factor Ts [endosymbiont of Euscepes postfasciatus]BBA84727.1 elongation factor Ts [endosymbiont of Euscepes postfasciatus]
MYYKNLKKLRELTNINIIDCKKALDESNNDINTAILILKKYENNFNIKNNNLYNSSYKYGIIISEVNENNDYGFIMKLLSNNDLVLKNDNVLNFYKKVSNFCISNKIKDFDIIRNNFNLEYKKLIFKLKENLIIKDFKYLEGNLIKNYVHINKRGVIVNFKSFNNIDNNFNILKFILMQIIFSNPIYIYKSDIKKNDINNIRNIIINKYKDKKINENNLIEEKINHFLKEKILEEQIFIMDNNLKMKDLFYKYEIKIDKFKMLNI